MLYILTNFDYLYCYYYYYYYYFYFYFLFFFKFYLFIYLFIYLWLSWVFVSVRGLSLVAASGGHSSSRCAGPSLSRSLLLRSTGSRRAGSVIVAHGPSRSVACGIFPDQGSNPCPLHWQADSQPLRHQGSPTIFIVIVTLVGVKWYLTVVLTCISLMANDVEHLSRCLLAICISYLGKCLFRAFAHVLIGWVVLLLLHCKSSLYTLDVQSLSDK